jgi:hypothetical protein
VQTCSGFGETVRLCNSGKGAQVAKFKRGKGGTAHKYGEC